MMLLKFLHLLGVMGFAGGIATQLAIARMQPPAVDAATLQRLIDVAARLITGPSLLLMLASGMLIIAFRPAYLEKRWLWAKLLLTMVIAPAAWFGAGQAAMVLALALAIAAAALAVWRPRLGRGADSTPDP